MSDPFNELRIALKALAAKVKEEVQSTKDRETTKVEDKGEIIANLMLTYRHLEDASMRVGKAIQARDGGASVYDKASTVGA